MSVFTVSSGWNMASVFSSVQQVITGTTLFRQDDHTQSVVFIVSGWVGTVRLEQDGKERITALYQPGSLLGLAELFAGQSETAIALSSCQHRLITARVFFNLIESDTRFAGHIFRTLSRQNYALKICSAQWGSVLPRQRSEQLIWQLLQAQNRDAARPNVMQGECKLLVPMQNLNLAQMLSVSRESFSRTLGEMEKDGVLHRRKGRLIFLNPERLWRSPEIESLVESNRGQISQFTLADPIYA